MYESRIDLPPEIRKRSIAVLQARLSDALDLAAQMKQAHWNVKGRDFFQLHQLFDNIHKSATGFVDALAERITALGGIADGRVQTTARASTLYEYPLQAGEGDAHLKAVAVALANFGRAARADIAETAAIGDADASDLLTGISQATDKQLWFVEAHLGGA